MQKIAETGALKSGFCKERKKIYGLANQKAAILGGSEVGRRFVVLQFLVSPKTSNRA